MEVRAEESMKEEMESFRGSTGGSFDGSSRGSFRGKSGRASIYMFKPTTTTVYHNGRKYKEF